MLYFFMALSVLLAFLLYEGNEINNKLVNKIIELTGRLVDLERENKKLKEEKMN